VICGDNVILVPYRSVQHSFPTLTVSHCQQEPVLILGRQRRACARETTRLGYTENVLTSTPFKKYHEWMKSPELLEATASEPLSLDEEYEMQRESICLLSASGRAE
jgi:hypothetical protein